MCKFQISTSIYIDIHIHILMHVASNHDKLILYLWGPERKWDENWVSQGQDEVLFWQAVSRHLLWDQGPRQALWSQLLRDNKPPSSNVRHWHAHCMTTALPASGLWGQAHCLCLKNLSTPRADLQPQLLTSSPTPEVASPYSLLLDMLFSLGTLLS